MTRQSDARGATREQYADKRALVIGAGRSGTAAAKLLVALGARVILTDLRKPDGLGPEIEELSGLGVDLALGGHAPALLDGVQLVVLSPGVPTDLPLLRPARGAGGVEIIGELELASRFLEAPCAAISGTNGKSTVTLLLGAMAAAAGRRVFVGGNIGQPLSTALFPSTPWDLVVAEVSSFQLETIEAFHPRYTALLNVTPDHLDRYPDFEHYLAAKRRLFLHAAAGDVAVLNADDPRVREIGRGLPCRVIWFGRAAAGEEAVWCHDGVVMMQVDGSTERLWPVSALRVAGPHMVANALAATALARAAGVESGAIERAVREFEGQAHCLETVADYRDVRYVNDSKGTNVDATVKALESFDRPIVWIGGGLDKGSPFDALAPAVERRVKRAVLFGSARQLMARALGQATAVEQVETLGEAFHAAVAAASAGDLVLFSPACASFDQFRDYRERGERFRALVRELTARG